MLNNNKKILVSDYDRTFYLNDNDIEKNIKEIENFRNAGNLFIVATGRSFYDFKKKVNLYNIKYDYVILNHGATILDNNDNILFNFSINTTIVKNLEKDLNIEKSIKFFCCSKLDSRVDINCTDLTKVYLRFEDTNIASETNNKINSTYSKDINSYLISPYSIEIITNKINKSSAIQLLIDDLHLDKSNVYTIGDGYSDIKMIKDYNGCCMLESVKELKHFSIKEYNSVSNFISDILNNNL
ncbi:MAG: HAD-IIB family hydrolase [Clostridiaceae bacterium]|nr:HAD-IIB family hydrolase [Clostridiaceae bacterium]